MPRRLSSNAVCHSERSEESTDDYEAWILRVAQNDRVLIRNDAVGCRAAARRRAASRMKPVAERRAAVATLTGERSARPNAAVDGGGTVPPWIAFPRAGTDGRLNDPPAMEGGCLTRRLPFDRMVPDSYRRAGGGMECCSQRRPAAHAEGCANPGVVFGHRFHGWAPVAEHPGGGRNRAIAPQLPVAHLA